MNEAVDALLVALIREVDATIVKIDALDPEREPKRADACDVLIQTCHILETLSS